MPSHPIQPARRLCHQDLQLLVCPSCHSSLRLDDDAILCTGCGRTYSIVDNLPVLLIEPTA